MDDKQIKCPRCADAGVVIDLVSPVGDVAEFFCDCASGAEQVSRHYRSNRVDSLIARGAVQVSRKHRRVFVPPADPVAWLRENHPAAYDALVERLLSNLVDGARAHAHSRLPEAETYTLEPAEFAEFWEKTNGRKFWTTADKTACPGCGSFGQFHRRDCAEAPR